MYSMSIRLSLMAIEAFLLPFYGPNSYGQAVHEINFQQTEEDQGLAPDEVFLNLTQTPRHECFYQCAMNCPCMAFQMFRDTECQLLSSSRFQMALLRMPGYKYYDIIPWKTSGCSIPLDCCKEDPCLNGGTCHPPTESDHQSIRFRCVCRKGYDGTRCQYRTDCQGHVNSTKPADGVYTLVNRNTLEPFQVYCRFYYVRRNPDVIYSWVLIQSYELQNVSQIKPFITDAPINEKNVNWKLWRLSKPNMNSLVKDADRWELSCDYDKLGWGTHEMVRVKLNNFDLLKEGNAVGKCIVAVRFSVRGESCRHCNMAVTQTALYPLHINTDAAASDACNSSIPSTSVGCHEDSFGWYACTNTTHGCAASPTSTTQTWLGL